MGSKITPDGDGSHEIKRHLLPGRKVVTKPDSILKSKEKPKQHIHKQRLFFFFFFADKGPVQLKLWFFQESCIDLRVGPESKVSDRVLMVSNCGVGENS